MLVDEALTLSRFLRGSGVGISDILVRLGLAGGASFKNIICDINYVCIGSYAQPLSDYRGSVIMSGKVVAI
jgi:hypothetical protein